MTLADFENQSILRRDVPLAELCGMKTGGSADLLFTPRDTCELRDVLAYIRVEGLPLAVIGNASNVLFPDEGLRGAVILTTAMKDVRKLTDEEIGAYGVCPEAGRVYLYAQAGASLTALSRYCAEKGFAGLEFAYGIPGTVGGAIFMNAGAYGGEMSDVLVLSEYLDPDGGLRALVGAANELSYRHSVYGDRPDRVIVGGVIALTKGNAGDILSLSLANMQKRRDKQPLNYPSCGSAFKRPEGHFAGALIEEAGLKGAHVGGAYVSEKHAGFIVNKGGATTADVLKLIELVQKRVYETSGVVLEPEIRVLKNT